LHVDAIENYSDKDEKPSKAHVRVASLGIRRMSGNEKDPIKFTSE